MYEVVQKLQLPEVEEALACLYHHKEPEQQALLELENQDWVALAQLLHQLMLEKNQASLH
jgi:predicted amidophosphoribosyltransferase